MELIYQDKQRRIIKNREEIKFSSFSSFHLLTLTARARSETQISEDATDDEELTVTIDGKIFPKLESKEAILDSPASFNGGELHNVSKTVYFLTFLQGRNHSLTLLTDQPQKTATFENLAIYTLNLEEELTLESENQAEDGYGRPWITFILDNLSLKSFTPTITYSRRKRDSDDIKIIIDGKVQENLLRTIKHFLWRYVGSRLPWSSPEKTETQTFTVNLPRGLHYLEFHADRMPILHELVINFRKAPEPPIRIPTVDDSAWTKNFYDDTPQIILARAIFGETEGASRQAKIAVGWTIKNRVLAQREKEWGTSYHEVILKPSQYEAFAICISINYEVFEY